MSNVSNTAAVNDPGLTFPQTPAVQPNDAVASEIEQAADFRLVIEEDQASGSYVYKTLDRRTGQVIQQFPREEVLKLKDDQAYNAGGLINARA
jgi:flagellar protein FlaG